YTSLNGIRTDYGLATPGPEVEHDKGSGVGGFASLIFGPSQANQFRFNASFERDNYQVPNDRDAQDAGVRDSVRQRDGFLFLTWVHTAGPHFVLTVSPFYHFTGSQFLGGPEDNPLVQRHDRSSHYGGVHLVATAATSRHSLKFGFYGFFERDNNFFGLRPTDDAGFDLSQRVKTDGNMEAFFVGDQYRPNDWLSITGGVRLTRFKGAIGEHAVDPRIGGTLHLPRLNWVLHGFYGRYYQEPPLSTVSGPLLELAETRGFTGVLPYFDFSPCLCFLDHDQRDTLTAGSFLSLPWDSYLFGEFHYGSGFTDDEGPAHLPGHGRLDLGGGKKFGKNWSVTINA